MSPSADPLMDVFRQVMRDPALQLGDSATFEDVEEWDSVTHVSLIAAIEQRFRVSFAVREIMDLNSVGAIRQALAAKNAAKNGAKNAPPA